MGPCEFHSVRAGWLAAVAAFGWLLAATPCHAWQQYHTTQGKPMRWSVESLKHPLVLDLDDSGLSNDSLSPAAVLQATQTALLQWQQLNCPMEATEGVQAQCADGSAASRPLGIEFGSPEWRPAQAIGLGCAATAELPCATLGPNGNQITFVHAANNWPYGKGVIAMTVVSAVKSTGLIADADIAVNDAGYSFCLATCLPGQIHFGEVILHEAGHFLGLDHSADPAAVMFAKPPEVINKMGALAADDKAGACAAYAATAAAPTCSPLGGTAASDSGGCGAGAAGSGWPSMGLLLAAVVGWARRRHFTAVSNTSRKQH